jgi:hypothetical protein
MPRIRRLRALEPVAAHVAHRSAGANDRAGRFTNPRAMRAGGSEFIAFVLSHACSPVASTVMTRSRLE